MASVALVMSDMLPARSADLGILRELLSKHQVPGGVKARFIHERFNVVGNEVRKLSCNLAMAIVSNISLFLSLTSHQGR